MTTVQQTPPIGTDHRGLAVLSTPECLRRIAETPVGRLGVHHEGDILILPVNHVLDGMTVAFRTSWGAKLVALTDGAPVSFETDGFDAATRTGWSVLVKGIACWVDDDAQCRRLERSAGPSWLPDAESVWVRIRPEEITGRLLLPAPVSAE